MTNSIVLLMIAGILGSAAVGIPLAYAMAVFAFAGPWLSASFPVAVGLIGDTAFGTMREYIFIVVPLFDAMGFLVARSGAADDLFVWLSRALRRVPAKLAIGTVVGNAIFATVTGIGAVSAVTFSRVAYPQMRLHGYDTRLAFGCVAGSSVLSLFLPPAVLVIIWGLLTEQSVGQLFLGAVLPGLLLATLFAAYCLWIGIMRPHRAPADRSGDEGPVASPAERLQRRVSLVGIACLMSLVLGGIWGGFFTPAEASAFGLLGATILFKAKGKSWHDWLLTILDSGRTTAPLLLLLISAQMFSRMLAFLGVTDSLQAWINDLGAGLALTFMAMVLVWLVLGSMLDSVSIMLLTAPIFYPIAHAMGMSPIAFALSAILFIEAGLLHPPFGLVVYLVKAAINDPKVTLADGFWGTLPFCFMVLAMAAFVALVPSVATWLPTVVLSR